jgi:hypothetical protein
MMIMALCTPGSHPLFTGPAFSSAAVGTRALCRAAFLYQRPVVSGL